MRRSLICLILLWSVIFMHGIAEATVHKHTPPDIVLPGPNGVVLKLSHGMIAKPDSEHLYEKAEILRQGRPPVTIQTNGWVIGDDAEDRDGPMKDTDGITARNWSLGLWSCDGHYIVLMTVKRYEDGTWDFRNSSLYAYDTTTGEYTEFDIPTALLGTDNFVQWSPTKCDVAILRGDKGNEEAKPTQ